MAFLNRVGNVLKQAVSKHAASSKFMAPNASLFQAMRCMSTSSKLFVGGAIVVFSIMVFCFSLESSLRTVFILLQVSHIAQMN